MCTYHGWTYDLKGALVGVPGFKEVYHEELDRENWGLIKAGQVDTYKGFIFATMDPEAVGLQEFLGDVGTIGLSLLAERGDDMQVVPGIQKYTIDCNWKLAVDNLFDWYHPFITHFSTIALGMFGEAKAGGALKDPLQQTHLISLGDYGHAMSGPLSFIDKNGDTMAGFDESWRDRPAAKEAIPPGMIQTQAHPNIFPNLWVSQSTFQLSLRVPKGSGKTEIWCSRSLTKASRKPATTCCEGRPIISSAQQALPSRTTVKTGARAQRGPKGLLAVALRSTMP